jgi:hypothetical protein
VTQLFHVFHLFFFVLFGRYLSQTGAALTNKFYFFHFKSYRKTNIPIFLTLHIVLHTLLHQLVTFDEFTTHAPGRGIFPSSVTAVRARGVCGVEI